MAAAIARRRTDRRAFGDRPVPEAELTKLRRFAEAEGAYLHVVRPDQIPALAVSTELAAGAERDDLLTSGEAPSALLLLATADGLATAPLSDAIEVEWPHQLLRGLLAGIGEPHLVIRPGPTSFVLRHVTSGMAQSLTRQGARPACPGWPALTFLRR